MRISDNSSRDIINPKDFDNLQRIANRSIDKIYLEDTPNLLVFPQKWQMGMVQRYGKMLQICSVYKDDRGYKIQTGNVMGFIGITDNDGYTTELSITSRFENKNKQDFFLHYMLAKVCGLNVVNLNLSNKTNGYHDLLKYLFPPLLQSALSQGLYKEYQKKEYNDANVRGPIDVSRHIRFNIPFNGKIAYHTREFSYDNKITELIRHTIEYLRTTPSGEAILMSNDETKRNVSTIIAATPAYKKCNLYKILHENANVISHPFFIKYRDLQILCKMILYRNYSVFANTKNQIHGILFDGAWLWEEYIGKVFAEHKTGIIHKKGCDKLFIDDDEKNQGIIPDFIRYKERPISATFIGDTKYKHIDKKGSNNREDYYQILSYMFRYSCKTGFLIFPFDTENADTEKENQFTKRIRILADDYNNKHKGPSDVGKNKIIELGMKIPQDAYSFQQLFNIMQKTEKDICHLICPEDSDVAFYS